MFFRENNDMYLGETTIPNVFIDIFMPMANGLYVKVYLLGYKHANDFKSNINFNNKSIAKHLNVPLSDVDESWKFWERKKIIKIHKNDEYDNDYSIEFLDLDRIYRENIYNSSISSNVNNVISNIDDDVRKMFNDINKIIGRYLDSNEKIKLLDIKEKYNMSCDMIVFAYNQRKENGKNPRPVNYMETIFKSWYDDKLYTIEDIKNNQIENSERYKTYKKIFKELGFFRNPSKSEEETIDKWLDEYNFDLDVIFFACSKSKNVSNPSITFINSFLEKWNQNNLKTLDEVKLFEENKRKTNENTKNNYQNYNKQSKGLNIKTRHHEIEQTFTKYSDKELEELLLRSQRNKFK